MTRRLTAVAAIALTVLALAACRNSPKVAAYVGDQTFTEDYVTELTSELDGQVTREQVVQFLVFDALCTEITGDAKVKVPAPETALPAGSPQLATIASRMQSCLTVVPSQPVEPTDADVREVFDTLVAGQAIPPGTNYDDLKDQFAVQMRSDQVGLAEALGKRATLNSALDSEDVSINPRYSELAIPVLTLYNQQQQEFIALMAKAGGSGAVTEAPSTAQPTNAPAAS